MEALADRYEAFLFDLDGVVYRGPAAIPEAPGSIRRLREMGKRIAFVTNNSARTPEDVAAALRRVGVPADPAEVETSALTTATVLAARGVRQAFVVGEEGIRRALLEHGIAIVGEDATAVDAVVVGWDRGVDYAKLRTASLLVERGAALVATNADASFPSTDGDWPGAGAILAAIETTTGVKAEVIGKPHPPVLLAAWKRVGEARPLLIGDRLETDIEGAAGVGWDSFLVLTGISTREDIARATAAPTYVGEDLSYLFREAPD